MAETDVLGEVRDGIAILTLNRPDRMNGITPGLEARMFELIDEAAADDAVKVIVLTGAGRAFSAGADMGNLQKLGEGGGAPAESTPRLRPHRTYELLTVPKPIIGAVNGACAGLGLIYALMCDVRFAAKGAKFTTAFVRRGLIAEHASSWVLPKLIGPSRALDLLLSGRVFLAEEAEALGLVSRAVDPELLLDETLAYAADLAANCSPSSMAGIKREVWGSFLQSVTEATASADLDMVQTLANQDFREGVASYMEKRPPKFLPLSEGWYLNSSG